VSFNETVYLFFAVINIVSSIVLRFLRELLKIKQKETPTEYNLLNYCILLLKESSYGAIFRSYLKLLFRFVKVFLNQGEIYVLSLQTIQNELVDV